MSVAIDSMVNAVEPLLGMSGRPNLVTNWYADRNGEYYRRAAWCNMTITWAAFHSGNYDAVCFGKDYAYTVAHAQRFQAAGRWHTDVAGIQRGDIVFFDWQGTDSVSAIDHVGLVTDVNGRDIFTIEGNTSDRVARRVRSAAEIAGYGRPAYGAEKPKPKPSFVTYPGEAWFKAQPDDPIVTAMGKRLVAEGCGRYASGPGPKWSEADRASYAAWQRKLGYTGSEADGWPGKSSWDRLKVPR